MHRVTAAIAPPSWSTASRSTTSKYSCNLDWSWPPSVSPTSLNHGLQVHLETRSIMASKCILDLHDLGLQVQLRTRSITASKCISELLKYGLQMHLQSRSITPSMCIYKLARSRPRTAALSYSISACKCISTPTWSRPPSPSPCSTRSRPPSASPNSLDRGLQEHLPVHTIIASKCISKFSQSGSPGTPAITLQYCLQPDWPYVYI